MQTDKTDGALVVSEIVWQGAVKEATSGDAEETDIKSRRMETRRPSGGTCFGGVPWSR